MDNVLATPSKPFAIQSYLDQDADVITWLNWRVEKDWGLYFFLTIWTLLWAPITFGITYATIEGRGPFIEGVIFFPLFWLGLLISLSVYLRLGARETIRVTNDHIEIRRQGLLLSRMKRYPRDSVRALSLERYDDESIRTLNLWSESALGLQRRFLLAQCLSAGAKAEVYRLLRTSFERREWAVNCRLDREAA